MFSSIEDIVADIRQGKIVIIVDDENRENEGDFIMAAEKVTPEHVNFMITHGRGLVCLPIAPAIAQRVALQPLPKRGVSRFGTNFTVSVEAAAEVGTGISTADRTQTIQMLIADDAVPEDIVSPGHMFPIIAHPEGVTARHGHTEAACDLASLAGFKPAGVLVEILNQDGTMARRDDLSKVAERFGLKMGTVADLVQYQQQK